MVVIEPATDSAAEESSSVGKRENGRDPEASISSTDEGFETASDGEGGGDDEGKDGVPTPPTAPSRGESYEDALNDEQLKQFDASTCPEMPLVGENGDFRGKDENINS
ncbi:hypothetical protein ACLOJK_002719 [Asimina triloba]